MKKPFKYHGGQAFPRPAVTWARRANEASSIAREEVEGMTLRDYMATHAMAGMCQNTDAMKTGTAWIANHAYIAADAMLAEREKLS